MGSIRSLKPAIVFLPQQRREHGAPFFRQPEPPRIALNETSHDQGRHRHARDAGVLPIRVAGGPR